MHVRYAARVNRFVWVKALGGKSEVTLAALNFSELPNLPGCVRQWLQ